LETGDSDAHHHPYGHRHEHRGGELHVRKRKPSSIPRRGGRGESPHADSLRCLDVEIYGNDGVEEIGNPHGHDGGHVAIDGKGGRDGLEKDVGETEGKTYTEVESHATLGLLAREGEADGGEDEGGKGHGNALVVLDFELLDVGNASGFLLGNVGAEFGAGHGLLLVLHDKEVGRLHGNDGVHGLSTGDDFVLAFEITDHVVLELPSVGDTADGVVGDGAGGEVGDELLVLKLVEREAVAGLVEVLVALDVGYDVGLYGHLYVAGIIDPFLLDIPLLKVEAHHTALGDDVGAEPVGHEGYDSCRNHVGAHQALQAHATGEHGDDFGVLGQLGGEEDDGNEDKECTEEIGKVGDEVEVIVKHDGLHGGVVLHELVNLFVEVEHYGNAQYQGNGKEVGAQELGDDVAVEPGKEFH